MSSFDGNFKLFSRSKMDYILIISLILLTEGNIQGLFISYGNGMKIFTYRSSSFESSLYAARSTFKREVEIS